MNDFTLPWVASGPLLDSWMKSVNDFWSGKVPVSGSGSAEKANDENTSDKNAERWESGWEAWKSFFPFPGFSLSETASERKNIQMASPRQHHPGFQNIIDQMAEPVFSAITRMLAHWQSQFAHSPGGIPQDLGAVGGTDEFAFIEKEILSVWNRLYDHEIRKFFTAPQLGLAREHQEKIVGFLDKWNLLQAAMAEFLVFLSMPFKKTHSDFQKKLTELFQRNALPQDAKGFYRIWLKILEGHYMILFQSPEYGVSLGKTLSATAAWSRAKKDLVDDLLRQMSLPSSGHLDGVYKDLHELKKRIRTLERAAAGRSSR